MGAVSGDRGSQVESLVGPLVVVELNSGSDGLGRMLLHLGSLPMDPRLFQRPDQALHRPVLLQGVGCDERLFGAVAAFRLRMGAAREDEPMVRP